VNKELIINIIAFLLVGNIYAQNRILSGKIVDENFEPIPFVSIKTIQNENNFVADKLGNFEIEIAESEKEIEVNYVGLLTEKVNIENKCYLNIIMLRNYIIEFETIQEEAKFYKKLRRKTERKYKQAIKNGILKKEENCR
jgi:iron complex outermembrane receptor protein